jgi:uncharacterized protein
VSDSIAGSTVDQPASGPIRASERHLSMDVVRGIALFGILLMNITGFGYADISELAGKPPWQGAEFWSWYIPQTFFEGTQRGLFSILFGAGVIVLTSRAEKGGAGISMADIYYRRNIWLIAWGMVNSYLLLWDDDILYFYGLAALFLFPLRNMKPAYLILIGLACGAVLTAQNMYDRAGEIEKQTRYEEAIALRDAGESLDDEQQGAIDSWEERVANYYADEEKRQERIDNHTTSYSKTFMHHLPDLTNAHGNDAYRWMILDSIAFMAIGMALFRLGILTLEAPSRIYWLMLIVGYGIGIPIRMYTSAHMIGLDFDFTAFWDNSLSYNVHRLFMTMGHLGLLLLFVRSGILGWLQQAIAAVGRTALTNYIMHSVIALVIFLRPGFGLYGQFERHELYYIVAAICVFQLIVSPIWLKHYRFGPLEWIWRSLTYQQRQPMRRV